MSTKMTSADQQYTVTRASATAEHATPRPQITPSSRPRTGYSISLDNSKAVSSARLHRPNRSRDHFPAPGCAPLGMNETRISLRLVTEISGLLSRSGVDTWGDVRYGHRDYHADNSSPSSNRQTFIRSRPHLRSPSHAPRPVLFASLDVAMRCIPNDPRIEAMSRAPIAADIFPENRGPPEYYPCGPIPDPSSGRVAENLE